MFGFSSFTDFYSSGVEIQRGSHGSKSWTPYLNSCLCDSIAQGAFGVLCSWSVWHVYTQILICEWTQSEVSTETPKLRLCSPENSFICGKLLLSISMTLDELLNISEFQFP